MPSRHPEVLSGGVSACQTTVKALGYHVVDSQLTDWPPHEHVADSVSPDAAAAETNRTARTTTAATAKRRPKPKTDDPPTILR